MGWDNVCVLCSLFVLNSTNHFDHWFLHEYLMCVKWEMRSLSYLTKLSPQWTYDNIFIILGVPLCSVGPCWIYYVGQSHM